MPEDGTPGPQGRTGDDAWARRVSRGVAKGDRETLAEFYSAWFDRCLASARRATGGKDESFCLDVVQDAMIKAASRLRAVQSSAELGAWMERVVHSCALDRLRAESARQRRERSIAAREAAPAAADVAQQVTWLEVELAAATPADRDLLRHRVVGDATLEQAGFAAGVTGPAAHGRLRRLLMSLRRAAPNEPKKGEP